MKILPIIAAVIIIMALGTATYLLMINQNSPTSALMNAKKLVTKNVTVTYEISILPTLIMGNNAPSIPGIPFMMGWINGLITISRTPPMDATVINGTLYFRHFGMVGIKLSAALWRHDNSLCYAYKLGFMIPQTVTNCVPYTNITGNFMTILNESRYVGKGSWDGETTYCFTASVTLIPTQASSWNVPIILNVTKMCLLDNGIPANITIYVYPAQYSGIANFIINANFTLVSYSFTFNQYEFTQITNGLIPG
ncbi:MAG: hypothetical protein ACP5GY_03365 [Vulcanisaeta sp.]